MNKRAWTPNAQKQMWRYGGAWDIDNPYVGLEAMDSYTEQPKISTLESSEKDMSGTGIFWYTIAVLIIVGLLWGMNKN